MTRKRQMAFAALGATAAVVAGGSVAVQGHAWIGLGCALAGAFGYTIGFAYGDERRKAPVYVTAIVDSWAGVRLCKVGTVFVGPIERGQDHGRIWRVRDRLTNGYVLVQTPIRWETYVVPIFGPATRTGPEPYLPDSVIPQVPDEPALPWRAVS